MRAIFKILAERQQRALDTSVISLLTGPKTGAMMLLDGQGGVIDSELPEKQTLDIVACLAHKIFVKPQRICLDEATMFFWDQMEREKRMLVLGAGHVSRPLVQFLCDIGFCCTVLDDRMEFADPVSFPPKTTVLCGEFGLELDKLELKDYLGAIVVTRGHAFDLVCLRRLLPAQLPYTGLIGSSRRVKLVKQILRQDGVQTEALERMYAPIGLDIGSETPAEIALSIAAEVLSVLRYKSGKSLKEG